MLRFAFRMICLVGLSLAVLHDLAVRSSARVYEGTLARTVRDNPQLHPTGRAASLPLDPMKDARGWRYKLLDIGELLLIIALANLVGPVWSRTWRIWWVPRTQDRPSAN